ncbi:hypothetical protein TIFTF001_033635 [Ficus carica]|uniref:Uncharacterized protein n=1 Tax=Ficus carica TaxID=3494 RepID=A0AA88E2E6_FICCA|nr:hypothetical protein TIFTF001_033635 [Ficus carica]
MKLHDAEYSSNTSGNLSSRRLSGLTPNSELTEIGRANGNKIFSGLSEKRRSFDSREERTSRDSSEYHHVERDTIFSGLTEKYRASKKSPENLHDPAGTRISDLTGKHRHSSGGGCSCSSSTMQTRCKLDPLLASKLAVPHKLEEAEENDKLFSGQILNPYCEHSKTKSNCEKPNYFHNSTHFTSKSADYSK